MISDLYNLFICAPIPKVFEHKRYEHTFVLGCVLCFSGQTPQ